MAEEIKCILTGSRQVAAQMDDSLTTADVHELFDAIELGRNWLYKTADLIESLTAELERVRRERDAAVNELSYLRKCSNCKKHSSEGGECYGNHACGYGNPDWEWRGACEDGTGGRPMSVQTKFTDYMNDIERYLRSRFPDRSEHVIQEIAAYISNRTIVLTNDITRELELRERALARMNRR